MSHTLEKLNTFNVQSHTAKLYVIKQSSDIAHLLKCESLKSNQFLLLGAGSNLLLLDKVPDVVVHMQMGGINFRTVANNKVIATVGAGISWHSLVERSLAEGYSGLENLALIPGLVGAAPIQNIGAYGVEICERFISLTAVDLRNGKESIFSKDECHFGYRDSFFKHDVGQYFLVTSVQLELSTEPKLELKYKALSEALANSENITPQMVFDKVCEIRGNNLPDPKVLGNAGSFFKNPIVDSEQHTRLRNQFPDLISYPQTNGTWKLAAGWMIDKAGLKGHRSGKVGVHDKQALVLVNYGGATGEDLIRLAQYVQSKVKIMFSIMLEPEVTIIGAAGMLRLREISL